MLYLRTIEIDVGLSSLFSDHDNDFGNNKLTKLKSVTVNRNSFLDNEISNRIYDNDSKGKKNSFEIYMKTRKIFESECGNRCLKSYKS